MRGQDTPGGGNSQGQPCGLNPEHYTRTISKVLFLRKLLHNLESFAMTTQQVLLDTTGGNECSFDLVALNHPQSKYSAEQKIQACTYYITTGDFRRVSKLTGIPVATLNGWKSSAVWWEETLDEVKNTKNEELEAILTHALHLASEEIVDRLEHGNEVIVRGRKERVKIPARELSQLTNTVFEKRCMLRGDPSSIRAERKVDFKDLVDQFKEFSKELNKEKVVSDQ